MNEEEIYHAAELTGKNFATLMDQYRKSLTPVFRCSHSGLYFPVDYLKEWGRKYGIGLGSDPVSEILDTDYLTPLDLRAEVPIESIMHPVQHCCAQVDLYMADAAELEEYFVPTVYALNDQKMRVRAEIILERQWHNPRSQLRRHRPDIVDSLAKGQSFPFAQRARMSSLNFNGGEK